LSAKVFSFPVASVRKWAAVEAALREVYRRMPDGLATLEECLPVIRERWGEICVEFSVQPIYEIPGTLTDEQVAAIGAAVEVGVKLVAERLENERGQWLGHLVACEFRAAYIGRNGPLET
jgi:hypothetical protein